MSSSIDRFIRRRSSFWVFLALRRDILYVMSQSKDVKGSKNVKYCTECGAKLPLDAKFCSSCGKRQTKISDKSPDDEIRRADHDSLSKIRSEVGNDNIEGVRGWLLFFVISLVLSVVRFISKISLAPDCRALGEYRDACYDLSSFSSFNTFVLLIFALIFIFVIISIISKSWNGKKIAVGALLSYAVVSIVGAVWQMNIINTYGFPSDLTMQVVADLAGILLYVAVWCTYLLKSKRVKNTISSEPSNQHRIKASKTEHSAFGVSKFAAIISAMFLTISITLVLTYIVFSFFVHWF